MLLVITSKKQKLASFNLAHPIAVVVNDVYTIMCVLHAFKQFACWSLGLVLLRRIMSTSENENV